MQSNKSVHIQNLDISFNKLTLKDKNSYVDYLAKKNFITHILLKLNLKYNYSVSFWANNNDFNFFKKFFFTVFKRKKINIIIYNKQKNVEENFFDNFYLGYSDSF